MANIEHKDLPNADLHEPKGVSAASAGQIYWADGAGSGTWRYLGPHGMTYFLNIATPYTLTYPATFTKVAVTSTAGGSPIEFTEATTGRLTYTGSQTRHFLISARLSVAQASGANRDLEIALYKNGVVVAGSTTIITSTTAVKANSTSVVDVSLATNDYVEVYMKNDGAGGDVLVYAYTLIAHGVS